MESEKEKVRLRRSHLNDFERCPRKFYYTTIKSIQVKPQFQSIALRQGSYLHSLVSGIPQPIYFSEEEERERKVVEVMYQVMVDNDLLPSVSHEVFMEKEIADGVWAEGTLDMIGDGWFGEMKYTSKPDFYLHTFTAQSQLEFYFLLSDLPKAVILPVRVPQLRFTEAKESVEKYLERVEVDIRKRMSFYFPHYKPENEVKWGLWFYRREFDLDDTMRRLRWWWKEIKKCIRYDYWPQRKQNCIAGFECSYLPLCETGVEDNEALYEKVESSNGKEE